MIKERLKPTTWAAIPGKTYPVKDQLRAIGARWDPDRRAWMIPIDAWNRAVQIVKSQALS